MDSTNEIRLRAATPTDGRTLAKLIDIAGEGIPHWLWSGLAVDGQSALDVGEERARREAGGFSYRNAIVAERNAAVAGMMLGYRIAEPRAEDRAAVTDLPAPLRPFVELEHQSVGSFYVNALAVFPGRRDGGIGRTLLAAAEDRARSLGAAHMSIQAFEQNTGAVRLYERIGYERADTRPVRDHPCQPYYDGDVVLLLKAL